MKTVRNEIFSPLRNLKLHNPHRDLCLFLSNLILEDRRNDPCLNVQTLVHIGHTGAELAKSTCENSQVFFHLLQPVRKSHFTFEVKLRRFENSCYGGETGKKGLI